MHCPRFFLPVESWQAGCPLHCVGSCRQAACCASGTVRHDLVGNVVGAAWWWMPFHHASSCTDILYTNYLTCLDSTRIFFEEIDVGVQALKLTALCLWFFFFLALWVFLYKLHLPAYIEMISWSYYFSKSGTPGWLLLRLSLKGSAFLEWCQGCVSTSTPCLPSRELLNFPCKFVWTSLVVLLRVNWSIVGLSCKPHFLM